ncbi:sensor histidine kinase [Tunicatimonas pelagia]|uniref:sensor histidine kinase n=1 Tax=Tunicatimonas pelagia TaxID=931531 RepID=UPI002665F9E3|nr:ATP-binding protein [Tunicatimonas pelagia]WKN41703.1 ATP-binding protein [Tunicatimonas pelagia]
MFFSSKRVALLLGFSIALVTTAFLSLVEGVSTQALLVGSLLAFSSSYILIQVALDFLVFREIKKIYTMINKLRRKDLSFVEEEKLESSVNPLRRINREILDYAAHKQKEINDLKKMEEFRREFVANVSHELKTPIFAAQGFVYTLLDGAAEQPKLRKKFLKKAARSLDGLDLLVQDLLTLSQMETGGIKMHYEHFNIQETVQEVFDQLESEAEKKGITLKLENTQPATFVYADRQRIYQVMINLVGNAIKYTKQDGKIVTILFTESDTGVDIVVQDEGRGIPTGDIKRIFERFYRVEKSRARNKGGTGLGLAIVKHIVEAHKSEVQVKSKVGEGSTFSFMLPRGEKPIQPALEISQPESEEVE